MCICLGLLSALSAFLYLDWFIINYSAHVHRNVGMCHSVQQCGCVFNSFGQQWAFCVTADILSCLSNVGKAQELLTSITMALLYWSVPVSHNKATLSQHDVLLWHVKTFAVKQAYGCPWHRAKDTVHQALATQAIQQLVLQVGFGLFMWFEKYRISPALSFKHSVSWWNENERCNTVFLWICFAFNINTYSIYSNRVSYTYKPLVPYLFLL